MGQVVRRSGQQVKGHRNALSGANQVQAPAEKLLALGGTIAAEFSTAYLATAPRTLTHRQRHTVDEKHLTFSEFSMNDFIQQSR